jgi:hypothetical protein
MVIHRTSFQYSAGDSWSKLLSQPKNPEEAAMPQIILPVPAMVTSHYVIATNRPPEDLYTVVPWRVAEPFRRAAIEALKTPRLSAYTLTADETRWRFDKFLAGENDRRRIEEATHHLILIHQAGIGEQPFRDQAARAVARALADASHGVLIDPQARQIVLRDGLAANERERFRMGDQWFGADYEVDGTGERLDPKECGCLRITLLGLRRFGLPNLMIDKISCAYDLAALNLLRSLASKLLASQWNSDVPVRVLDDRLRVDPMDFWRFWAATPLADSEPVEVRLRLQHEELLEVSPPEDFDGTVAEWVSRVLQPAMPPLIGCPADEDATLRQADEIVEEGA